MITHNKKSLEILVDVVALSNKLCSLPIQSNLAYATNENFVGEIIDGYSSDAYDICLMTKHPALALCEVQNYLIEKDLGLHIYDAYRPLRAVKYFAKWFEAPVTSRIEIERKKIHYPNIDKKNLAKLGYVLGDTSKHNFGYAVDLVLIDINNNKPLEMGACFDFFDEIAHATATEQQISKEAYNNRVILSKAMQQYNFIPYEKEFWHFDFHLCEVDQPMDLPISKDLKNINLHLF